MAEENSSSASRSKGVVTRFNDQKGYGFILPEEGGDDLFVHHSAIKSDGYRTLREGQTVEFTIILDGDKTKAVDVTAPGGAPIDNNSSRRFGNGSSSYSRGGNGVECFNCGELGHLARDCANGRGNGGNNGGGGGSGCYNCGGRGHIARECPSAPRGSGGGGGACFNCGDVGHMARDCTRGRVGGGGGGGGGRFTRGGGGNGNCFNCGESGHYARDCNEIVMR